MAVVGAGGVVPEVPSRNPLARSWLAFANLHHPGPSQLSLKLHLQLLQHLPIQAEPDQVEFPRVLVAFVLHDSLGAHKYNKQLQTNIKRLSKTNNYKPT